MTYYRSAVPSRRWPIAPVLALLFALPLCADEVRLDDGRILIGKVARKGDDLEITTRDGVVVVPASRVVSHLDDAALRAKLAERRKSAGDSAFAHLQLAGQARAYGLERELWRHLDLAIARNEAGAAAATAEQNEARAAVDRRLRDFLAQLEPEVLPGKFRNAPCAARVNALLDLVRPETGRGELAAIVELLAREPNADGDLRKEARRSGRDRARIAAVQALQLRPAAGNDRFVWRTAILDRSRAVREGAIALVPPAAAPQAIEYLAPGLMHGLADVRVRTAEAFGNLGHRDALPLLVAAAPNAGRALAGGDGGNRGQRAHIAILNQQAYIRDFDVEVASAAFIADPKIDVLSSGTVLDVTVAGVVEVRTILQAYRSALGKIAASDPGADAARWPTWLQNLPAETAPTTPRR